MRPHRLPGRVGPVEGVLLGVDAVTVTGRPWVRLWLARGAQRLAAWLPDVPPVLYVAPAEGVAAADLLETIRRRAEAAEVVTRRMGRQEREVVRVVARHPGDLADLRSGLEGLDAVAAVLEADVTLEERAVTAHGLRGMAPVRGEGGADWRVAGPVLSEVGPSEADLPVEWRVAALAGEIDRAASNPDGAADRVRRLVLLPRGGEPIVLAEEDDAALLSAWVRALLDLDPDILLTWDGDVGLWPFLVARAEHLGVPLPLARDGGPPEVRGAGGNRTATLAGRAHVDLRRVADRDLRWEVKVKTLASVGEHVGVDVEGAEGEAAAEAAAVLAVGEALLPLQEAFARITRLPLDEASRAGRGAQVEALLLGEAARLDILAPHRARGPAPEESYEGGLVLDPVPGLHEDVVAVDFGAMYPSIMVAYNVSPDTWLPPGVEEGAEAWEAPEVGHRFRREPDGFFRRILGDLVTRRREMKRRMRALPEGPERARLDVEQASLKVLTNALYGYTGWPSARWGSRACAEATSAWGRHHVREVMEDARGRGMEVLYGDTDSLFLRAPQGLDDLLREANARLPLELEVADRFSVLLFTAAKKKYAGLTADGRLLARGFEIRRGDWCAAARRTQEQVLGAVLRERDPAQGTRAAREAVAALRAGKVPLEDLVIYKTLTSRPGSYKSKPMHAAAVERAEAARPGLHVAPGSKVGILLPEGDAPPHDRAVLQVAWDPAVRPDAEWYVDKQIVPAALRVLESFGVTAEDLKGARNQRSLAEFF